MPNGYTLEEYVKNFTLGMENTDGKNKERKIISEYFSRDKMSAHQIPYVQEVSIFNNMRELRKSKYYDPILSLLKQFKSCPPKSSLQGNRFMDGESLARFVKELFHAMNNNSWMDFSDAYQNFEGQICEDAYEQIVKPAMDGTASETIGNLKDKVAMFATKCALKEKVESARKDLLAAEKKAREIEESKRKAEEEEKIRKKVEETMKTAQARWKQESEEKVQKMKEEAEKRERAERQKKILEGEVNHMTNRFNELQTHHQQGGGWGIKELLLAAAAGLAAGAHFLSDQRLKQNITILPQSEYDIVNLTGVDWKWTETAREKFGLGDAGDT